MTLDEAIDAMEAVGHDFFVFREMESDFVQVGWERDCVGACKAGKCVRVLARVVCCVCVRKDVCVLNHVKPHACQQGDMRSFTCTSPRTIHEAVHS